MFVYCCNRKAFRVSKQAFLRHPFRFRLKFVLLSLVEKNTNCLLRSISIIFSQSQNSSIVIAGMRILIFDIHWNRPSFWSPFYDTTVWMQPLNRSSCENHARAELHRLSVVSTLHSPTYADLLYPIGDSPGTVSSRHHFSICDAFYRVHLEFIGFPVVEVILILFSRLVDEF